MCESVFTSQLSASQDNYHFRIAISFLQLEIVFLAVSSFFPSRWIFKEVTMTEKATSNAIESVTTPSIHSDKLNDVAKLNLDAYKSDDSDGKVIWTTAHRIAAFSLCLLYVGAIYLLLHYPTSC
jgi:hypothetical protein